MTNQNRFLRNFSSNIACGLLLFYNSDPAKGALLPCFDGNTPKTI